MAVEQPRGIRWTLEAATLTDARGHTLVIISPPGGAQSVGIDAQGGVVIAEEAASLRLSKLVVLNPTPERSDEPTLEPLTAGEALEEIVPRSAGLGDLRAPLRTIAAILDATGGAVRVKYRDDAAVDTALKALVDIEPPTRPLSPLPRVDAVVVDQIADDVTRYHRVPVADALTLDGGRLAILSRTGDSLQILDRISADLWRAAGGATAVALHASVSDESDQTLAQLVSDGLLGHDPAWAVSDDTAWTATAERSTVLNLIAPQPQPIALEGSSHVIWTILTDHMSMTDRELIAECAQHFETDPAEVADGVISLLHQLRDQGLVYRA